MERIGALKRETLEEATEKARGYLYGCGMHHNGDFHAMLGNGGFIDLAEVLAVYALEVRSGQDQAEC
jgi:hypothetical protein